MTYPALRLSNTLAATPLLMAALRIVRDENPPGWWIVGGVIRDIVWSEISGIPYRPQISKDVDVVYFTKTDNPEELERETVAKFKSLPGIKWSLKNQARMHALDRYKPFESAEESISKFPETVSAIGARLNKNDELILINCHGLDDLFAMTFRPTPAYLTRHSFADFCRRVEGKGWLQKWPLARLAVNPEG